MDMDELKDDGLAGFIKQLGKEMQLELSTGKAQMEVRPCLIDEPDQSHSLYWEYNSSVSGNVTIERIKYGGQDIKVVGQVRDIVCEVAQDYPRKLREAAQAYEDVSSFLQEKFGKPTGGHFRETHYVSKMTKGFL